MEILKKEANAFELLMKAMADLKSEVKSDIEKLEGKVSRIDDAIRGNGKIGLKDKLTAMENLMATKQHVREEVKIINKKIWKVLGAIITIIAATGPIIAAFIK